MPLDANLNSRRQAELEAMMQEVDSLAGTPAAESVRKAVGTVLAIHAHALRRIIRLLKAAGPPGEAILKAMSQDKAVANLLLLHGLHPSNVEDRVRSAVESVRQYVKSHGGDVELMSVSPDAVTLKMTGSCGGCSQLAHGLKLVVQRAIDEAAPEVSAVSIEA